MNFRCCGYHHYGEYLDYIKLLVAAVTQTAPRPFCSAPAAAGRRRMHYNTRESLENVDFSGLSCYFEEKTALYKAQRYSLNQREALDAVLLDGRLKLTNNLAERSVKPFVMSQRNFLFCDTAKGATSSALCFSMIETAKANNLDPFGYLLFLLQELPKLGDQPDEEQLRDYLPWSTTIPAYCRKK